MKNSCALKDIMNDVRAYIIRENFENHIWWGINIHNIKRTAGTQ